MKKRIVTLVVFLLIACMALTGCSSEGSKVENTAAPETATVETTEEPQDSDGMYEWTLSNGMVLKTKTNIMSYISDGIWNSNQFAIDLGWVDWDQQLTALTPTGYSLNGKYVRFSVSHPDIDVITEWFCYAINYSNGSFSYYVNFNNAPGEYAYSGKGSHYTITFDGIVLFTYSCEQLMENPNDDPFEELLGKPEELQYYLNKNK